MGSFKRLSLFVLVFVLLAALAMVPVLAQDATQEATPEAGAGGDMGGASAGTMGTVNCDSDLILMLYVADRWFGFSSVQNQIGTAGGSTVDTSVFNYGQFGPLFQSMRGMQDPNTMTMPNSGWSQEQLGGLATMLGQDDTTLNQQLNSMLPAGTDTSAISPLTASTVAGEAPECTALRNTLNRFFTALSFQDLSTGFMGSPTAGGMGDTAAAGGTGDTGAAGGTGAEATAEATAQAGG